MARVPVNPGKVEWSGENPGMYLKDTPEGKFTSLVTFFRVVLSPVGRGHACFVLEDPYRERSERNFCLTDNEQLARWLAADYVSRFGPFRDAAGLASLAYRPLVRVETSADGQVHYTENVQGDGQEVSLAWRDLGEPYMLELPAEMSATGQHEMFSVFVDAGAVQASVNGRPIAGSPQWRTLGGRQSRTAFLALSETWVRPK
jgi:hypothetical protein